MYPKNAMIRYREWYGWNGEADQGIRMESEEVAVGILSREEKGENISFRVGDTAMFAKHDGPSTAERMSKYGVLLQKAQRDRVQGYQEVRQRLAGVNGVPLMYSFSTNTDGFNRTIPDLVLDDRNPEDVDTRQEDHVFDETYYACLARPYARKKPEDPEPKRMHYTFADIERQLDDYQERRWWH